ncbi:hypothetical protein Gorai_006640, partial [Gossypium raimondii]|nr:hypothetical protein [Gossypium raimondii]
MAATTTVRLKLLIDSKSERVLFAEAGKDFSLAKKDTLSKPMISNYAANNVPLLFPNMKSSTTTTKIYGCSDYCCFTYLENDRNQRSKGSSSAGGGYVEGVVTHMVMNDL